MSKRNRPRSVFRLAALASALCVAAVSGGVFAQRARRAATVVNPRTAAVVAATAEVLEETSRLRELPVLRPVTSGAQSRADIEQMITRNLNEDTTPEEMRATEVALKKFGLVPPEFRLREFIVKLLSEQVAGYYEPKRQTFYLADWIDVDGQKPVMAHELTHALQDQHFNLRRFEKWPKGDSDAELAAQALVEGDATLVMTHYIAQNPLVAFAMMKSMLGSGAATEQIESAPRALRDTLLFPYEDGMTFARQLQRRGGWPLVSKAYAELPQSTEQILHVEKYFSREAPVKVHFPNLAQALGAGWRRTDYDVNGEWGYLKIIGEYLTIREESRNAAGGWAGDRYALYERARGGGVVLAQMTVWDTEQDAAEFFEAYARRTELRRSWTTKEGDVFL
ncbi:MAG TPA: hypothetical protein VGV38_02485, partial [Pyrinomonadaceae bacterium]|nr:hypothetical protein [Pyrinomonadaceae bacterium]